LPILFIPKDVQEGLAILRDIPDDVFNDVLLRLEHPEDDHPVKNLSPEDMEQVIDAITPMSAVRASADVSVDQFVVDICESLREQKQLPLDKEARLRDRLTRALGIEILNVKAKAIALSNEHEHLFCTARIFTDVRPVYGDDVMAPPAAMTITHTLKIDYHAAGGRTHEIYLGLGSGDIAEIREVLDRAEEKARSIRAALEPTKIPVIDPQE